MSESSLNLTQLLENQQKQINEIMALLKGSISLSREGPPPLDISPSQPHTEETETGVSKAEEISDEEWASLTQSEKNSSPEPEPPQQVAAQRKPVPFEVEEISSRSDRIFEEGDLGVSNGRRSCTRVPFSVAPKRNRFKDNAAINQEDTLLFDRKVRTRQSIAAHNSIQKRPPKQKVIVQCEVCNRRFRIDAELAPVRYESDESSNFKCDSCILKRKG
jgi:hypothetical protein